MATEPTAEASSKASRATGETAAKTSETTPKYLRSTGDLTTRTSQHSGRSMLDISGTLDATLAQTTDLTWKRHAALRLDPDIADELIKEAYASNGPTLRWFAERFNVPTAHLAATIRSTAPAKPTRTELIHLMASVVPALRS